MERKLKDNQYVLLLLVAESTGSSPGRQGFKMAVSGDGQFYGSIGGGIMEVKLVEMAKKSLQSGQLDEAIKKQIHRKDALQNQSGMICSGEQTIVFIPIGVPQLAIIRTIIRCLRNRELSMLKFTNSTDHQAIELLHGQCITPAMRFARLSKIHYLYEENLGPKNQLYIIGGGHCALALSELMAKLDFNVILLDDRPGLDTVKRNKFVNQKHILENYTQTAALVPSGMDTFVVIMTIGYRSDETVLRQLVDKKCAYIGVLGSASKLNTLFDSLRSDGIPEAFLAEIHAPIGLPIHSHTPEEIAVSIAAEIIQVKNRANT